ncbi:MAG: hypothetical protein ACI8RZ_005435 [Myxococcota bacterium]
MTAEVLDILLSLTIFFSISHAQEIPSCIDSILRSVDEAGLPVDLLESKAREGLAKGVPPARIASVLEGMQSDLSAASTLLDLPEDASDRNEVLSATASALRAEVSTDTLHRLASLPEQIRGPAIQSMVDLMLIGFSQAQSAQLVEDAAARNKEVLSSLTIASGALLTQGTSHVDAFQLVTNELAAGQSSLIALSQGNNGNGNSGNSGNGNSGNSGNGNSGNSGNGNSGNGNSGNGNSDNNGNGSDNNGNSRN